MTALTRCSGWLAMGFEDGNVELMPARPPGKGETKRSSYYLEATPSSPVVRLMEGPSGTLVAGYSSGAVGIWNVEDGSRLHLDKLHGPVVHMLLQGGRLYLASELGDHLVLDLRVFGLDHCQLLRQVWKGVPVVWKDGRPQMGARPVDHRCLADQP